ncbi:MAG: hypothetical protein ACI4TK_10930 [Agathobacter sp.]
MKEEEYLSAKAVYNEIENLRDLFSSGLTRIRWIISIHDNCANIIAFNNKSIVISESLSDEIIEVMRKRLATLEEQFKQM